MPPDSRGASRAEIARLEARARAKVRRIEKQGVRLSGSQYDPLRESAGASYRERARYADELRRFTSRNTQFVAGREGRPITNYDWQSYKRAEQAYVRKAKTQFEEVKDFKLSSGESVGERMAKITPTHRTMRDPAVNSPYDPPVREASQLEGPTAAKHLARSINNRAMNLDRQYKDAMKQFDDMMRVINEPEVAELAKSLTKKQFMTVWNYDALATAISLVYESQMKILAGKQQAHHNAVMETSTRQARKMIEHARTWEI